MSKKSKRVPAATDMQEHASDAAGLMKALGNESRLMILCVLADSVVQRRPQSARD